VIEAVDLLSIHQPALSAQQDAEPLVAVAWSSERQLAESPLELRAVRTAALVAFRGT
jgi:hypothetical protein